MGGNRSSGMPGRQPQTLEFMRSDRPAFTSLLNRRFGTMA